jgi:hypothetical protein
MVIESIPANLTHAAASGQFMKSSNHAGLLEREGYSLGA